MLPCQSSSLPNAKAQAYLNIADSESTMLDEPYWNDHRQPHILVAVTSPQTCLVLQGRLRALREGGFRVSLLSAPGQLLNDTARNEQVAAYAVPMERCISPVADVIALFRIWRLIRILKPDIVEFGTPKAGFLVSLAACLCGVPLRIYLLRGLKLETSSGVKRIVLLAAERIASACAHAVVCNSRSLQEMARSLRVASASKLVLLGMGSSKGVDLERYRPGSSNVRSRFGIPDDVPVIGFVGRLTRDKGIPELIEAFAAILRVHPAARLLLVGWFDAAEDRLGVGFRARIESHPNIVCTGFVEDAAPYYRAMELMVLPTLREGFPNVVLEAAATGVPVVGTLCTGSRDAVVHEVTGLLVPPANPEAICEAVLRLLRNPHLRGQMGKAALAWVAENYQDHKVLAQTIGFYCQRIEADYRPESNSTANVKRKATGLPVLP